jgi:hypothetical protein
LKIKINYLNKIIEENENINNEKDKLSEELNKS